VLREKIFPSEENSDMCHQKTEATVDEFLARHDMVDMAAPIAHSEMLTAAKTLKKKSAPGWDGVSTSLLLLSMPLLATYILTLLTPAFYMESIQAAGSRREYVLSASLARKTTLMSTATDPSAF